MRSLQQGCCEEAGVRSPGLLLCMGVGELDMPWTVLNPYHGPFTQRAGKLGYLYCGELELVPREAEVAYRPGLERFTDLQAALLQTVGAQDVRHLLQYDLAPPPLGLVRGGCRGTGLEDDTSRKVRRTWRGPGF